MQVNKTLKTKIYIWLFLTVYLHNNKITAKYDAVKAVSGAWGGVVVKALRYYSDGPGIDSRWCHW